MSYILYHKNRVYGCYGNVDMLRSNILIILFKLLERSQITTLIYENIVDYLTVIDFTVENFDIGELKNELRKLEINIEKITHEKDSFSPLEHIKEHIKYRFEQLEEKMDKDVRVTVKIPGDSAEEHELGTMYKEQWCLFDREKCDAVTDELHKFISKKLKELDKKFKKRIKYGDVYYQEASPLTYQVWSANAVNWNRPDGMDIPGCYQAQEMKYQEEGVYGIVVTPRYGYKNLVPKDITKFDN